MRVNRTLLSAFAVGIIGGALVSACQTYDFEPVEPLALAQTTVGDVIRAKAAKPNLMVLLDTSGSMTQPVDTSDPDCRDGNGNLCGGGSFNCDVSRCPTRWSEMRSAMASFLSSSGSIARMGLTVYPASQGTIETQCSASSAVKIPIPQVDDTDSSALQATANRISDEILNRPINGSGGPSGGTPTGASLRFVGAQAELQSPDRDDFVLLLTDGLPNCNAQNPNGGTAACNCGLQNCGSSAQVCLDKDASVAAVTDLRTQQNIRTIVIGFGADTAAGAGPETLNAMAEAGGFARNCTKDPNACGAGDTCDAVTKLCGRRFYQAANQAELANALREIIDKVGNTDPCLLALDPAQRPSSSSLIVVYVNDEPVPEGTDTWQLTDQGVQFVGQMCTRIRSSTDANPIKLEARAVQRK